MSDSPAIRMTESRKAILSALGRTRAHPTADEVFSMVRAELPKVSLGTVYRNHHHIRCEVCGRIDDIELGNTGRLDELLVDSRGYEVHGYTLCFVGVCRECAGNGKNHEEKGKGNE